MSQISELIDGMTEDDVADFAESIGMHVEQKGNAKYVLSPDGFRQRIANETGAPYTADKHIGSCKIYQHGIYDFAMAQYEDALEMAVDFLYPQAQDIKERARARRDALGHLLDFLGVPRESFSHTDKSSTRPEFYLSRTTRELIGGRPWGEILRYAIEDFDTVPRPGFTRVPINPEKANAAMFKRFVKMTPTRDSAIYRKEVPSRMTLQSLGLDHPKAARAILKEICRSRIEAIDEQILNPIVSKETRDQINFALSGNRILPYIFYDWVRDQTKALQELEKKLSRYHGASPVDCDGSC